MASDKMGIINETVVYVLAGEIRKKISTCSTLEAYDETPIFIPVEITEGVVKSLAQKHLGGSGPGGTNLEALKGWILKFREDSKKLLTSVETSVDWIANKSPPWASYSEFMSSFLIVLDKKPGIFPVIVGGTCIYLFPNCALKITVPEATSVCQDGQICAVL